MLVVGGIQQLHMGADVWLVCLACHQLTESDTFKLTYTPLLPPICILPRSNTHTHTHSLIYTLRSDTSLSNILLLNINNSIQFFIFSWINYPPPPGSFYKPTKPNSAAVPCNLPLPLAIHHVALQHAVLLHGWDTDAAAWWCAIWLYAMVPFCSLPPIYKRIPVCIASSSSTSRAIYLYSRSSLYYYIHNHMVDIKAAVTPTATTA